MSPDDPRFTAYALGEPQEPAVVAAIESALAEDAALRAELQELRSFTLDLTAAVKADIAPGPRVSTVASAPASGGSRLLPFRPEAESAPWRRQLARMAAVFVVSATAIGVASWWTSQRVTSSPVPVSPEVASVEIDLSTEGGVPSVEQARVVRASVEQRWAQLAASLRAGRIPTAAAVPAQHELLGLLPMVETGGGDQVRIASAAVPGDPQSAWLAVTIPAGLVVGGSVSIETRRMDKVTVRELASGFGPGGERVLLFGLNSATRDPEVKVHLAGTTGTRLTAAQLWQDFRHAPASLRQAVALSVVGEALRGPAAHARVALRDALKIAEAAGEAGEATAALGRRAAELLESEKGA
ncbi:MAG: hypothetical protein JSR82_17415 [Verrucomicrobia bacterium]|nr:hypothetical protein [Verrucomicrobiota bacterium]